jgi:hypothetical protein
MVKHLEMLPLGASHCTFLSTSC